MKSDIEIARSIELKKIKELAKSVGMPEDQVTHYGRHMAKVDIDLIDEEKIKKNNLLPSSKIQKTSHKCNINRATN